MISAASTIQLGDVASWIGSVATSAALFLTYGLLRLTRRDQQQLRLEQRLAQPRKVSAWCERVEPTRGSGPDRVIVRVRNASEEPIYAARVAVGSDWWSEKPRSAEPDLGYVIPPGYDEPHVVELRVGRTEDSPEPSPPVEIVFSDASNGRFWHRDRYGGLTELTKGLPQPGEDYFFKTPANLIGLTTRR